MDERIADFLNSKEIAVVGVSQKKMGGAIYRTLRKSGMKVYPVHHSLTEFENDKCYSKLAGLPSSVDAAVVAVSPANAKKLVQDAQGTSIKKLWFQRGADFSEVEAKANQAGLKTVSGKCILMYAEPVTGIHAFHRFLARLFGKL
jgi:predicted CoA-binding protein